LVWWKQKLAFSVSIFTQSPGVVFLDEPYGRSGSGQRDRPFWELILQMTAKRGITVFVTTHYMDEAEYCDPHYPSWWMAR
jgi:ABC-2 type transport system ATP-binding protein